jgi:hypothetical protein
VSNWQYDNVNLPDVVVGPAGPSGAMANVGKNVPSNAAARINFGVPSTITGTGTQPVPAATDLLRSLSRTNALGVTGAGQGAGWRSDIAIWWRGNAAGLGGFDLRWRFAVPAFVATWRAFVGLWDQTTEMPNVDPSSLTNIVGMGIDAGTSQWAIVHNDASGPATIVALGPAFAIGTTSLMSLQLTAAANGSSIAWIARNVSTAAIATGTITTNMPANNIFLAHHERVSTGVDLTTAPQFELVDIVVVTPGP